MSLGNLKIVGDIYKYLPVYPESYYFLNTAYPAGDERRRGLGYLNREVLRAVDSLYGVDFTRYDNWSRQQGSWVNSPDGLVDLVIITYRFLDAYNVAGFSFEGLALLDAYADYFPVVLDGKTIAYDQGITSRMVAPEGGTQIVAHELGHLLYGYYHHEGIGLNIAGFNAYERWLMGWTSYRTVNTNTSITDLDDFITTGQAIRIPTGVSSQYFVVENHQKLSPYETLPRWHGGPAQFAGNPGLYIFHVDETLGYGRLFVELASGRHDWMKVISQGVEYFAFPFQILGPNIVNGVTRINLPFRVYDAQTDAVRSLTHDEAVSAGIHGNQFDTFHESFKTEFSPSTNPATNLTNGTHTGIALRNIRKIAGTNYMGFDLQVTPSAPLLLFPYNGAANVSISPTLSWNASTGATSYRV